MQVEAERHRAHRAPSAWPGRGGESSKCSLLPGQNPHVRFTSELLLCGVTALPLAPGSHARCVGGLDRLSIRAPRYPNAKAEPVMQAWPPGSLILEGTKGRGDPAPYH